MWRNFATSGHTAVNSCPKIIVLLWLPWYPFWPTFCPGDNDGDEDDNDDLSGDISFILWDAISSENVQTDDKN